MERKSFLDQEPPPGYIAGIGRGATGFSTNADFSATIRPGNARQTQTNSTLDQTNIQSQSKDEDNESDLIFAEIEARFKEKRNKKRQADGRSTTQTESDKVVAAEESVGESLSKISEQFKDVKEGLSTISNEEWENLPESGDFTRRNKRLREELQGQQRFYRNSDLIAVGMKDAGATDLILDDVNAELENVRAEEKSTDNDIVNLFELSRTKDRLLETQIKLGNQKKQLELNKDTYLESLNPKIPTTNIGDYKKTRKLLTKLRETNPNNPQNWIASAKLEFEAQKHTKARQIIHEGCLKCVKSEEIWLTNLDMNDNDIPMCKAIVADAIKYNYKSMNLWLKAIDFEQDNLSKSRVARKALEWLPTCVELWIAAATYESETQIAIKMLQKAVTLIPESLDLWMKLASFQSIGDAIVTLTESTEKIKEEQLYLIWIKIAQLEEKHTENELKINKFITKAVSSVVSEDSSFWIHEAQKCEVAGYKLTCRAIILISMACETNVDVLLEACNTAFDQSHFEVSDSIFTYMITEFPQNIEIWNRYFTFKKKIKDFSGLFLIYEMAIDMMSDNWEICIRYCDDKIRFDPDNEKVRMILSEALNKFPQNESLWLYSIRFERKYGTTQIAADLFETCLDGISEPIVKFWIEKIQFERSTDNNEAALASISKSIELFPRESCLYCEKCDLLESIQREEDVKVVLENGLQSCNQNQELCIRLSMFYLKQNNTIKARSVLDEGLSKNPSSDILHHARIKLEIKTDNKMQAQRLLSKALSLNPKSSLLWCDNIKLATKQQIKNMYALALKSTDDDPLIILTIAKDLWRSGKLDKANQFFKACIDKDPRYGDAYIFYYAFMLAYGSREDMKSLEQQMLDNSPLKGHKWSAILKSQISRNVPDLQILREAAVDVSNLM